MARLMSCWRSHLRRWLERHEFPIAHRHEPADGLKPNLGDDFSVLGD
jgi:hypothetical protein